MQSTMEININLQDHEIMRSMGYKKGKKPSEETINMLNKLVCASSNKLQALGTYCIVEDFRIGNGELLTPYGCINSLKISSLAEKAEQILIGVVTVHNLNKTEEKNIMYDYLLHGIGIIAVEKTVDSLLVTIEKKTKLYASLPFSPGYCDWDISGQKFIFNALDPSIINVQVMNNSLRMLPVYTISFVSLLSLQKTNKNPCIYCDLKKCSTRRI